MNTQENFSEKDSLRLITEMINKTKQSFHDTGFGPILWGVAITVCALTTFAQIQFNFKLPFDIWLLVFVAIIPQIIISIKENKTKKVKTYNDIALDYTWIGFGICMFILGFSIPVIDAALNKIPNFKEISGNFKIYNYITSIYLMVFLHLLQAEL
jgi:hypothetical protein